MRLLILAFLLAFSLPSLAASRVISLTPALSEIMIELDSADLLVGILDGGERPAALAEVASVGSFGQFSVEALLRLQPDLILAMPRSISPAQQQQLIDLQLPVLELEPSTLEQLGDQFITIARAIGRPERGETLQARFNERIQSLKQHYRQENETPRRVFYQVWDQPLFTIGGKQIITDALRLCGMENIFSDLTLPAPQVGLETVLQRDPEIILAGSRAQLDKWKRWPQLSAVHEQRLWLVPDSGLERPSYQMVEATAHLCARVWGH